MMERRTFLALATGGLLAAPLVAEAQPRYLVSKGWPTDPDTPSFSSRSTGAGRPSTARSSSVRRRRGTAFGTPTTRPATNS